MKHAKIQPACMDRHTSFWFVGKSAMAMAALAVVLTGVIAPNFAASDLSWGQGLVALFGGILGAILAWRG